MAWWDFQPFVLDSDGSRFYSASIIDFHILFEYETSSETQSREVGTS